MIKIRKYLINYSYQIIARGIVLMCGLLVSRWIISNLTTLEYNQYTLVADSLNGFVLAVISFGIPQILHKIYTDYDKTNKDEISNFWSAFLLLRILSFGFGLIISIVLYKILGVEDVLAGVFIFLMQFILLADQSIRSVCDSLGRTWQFGTTDLVSKVVLVVLLYSSVQFFDSNIYSLIFAGLVSYFSIYLLDIYIQRDFLKFKWPDFSMIKKYYSPMVFLTLSSITSFFYVFVFQTIFEISNLDIIDVNSFSNSYNRVFITFITFPNILIPNLSSKFKIAIDKKDTSKIKKIISVVLLFSLFTFFGFIFIGPFVLQIIDPQNLYPKSKDYIYLLSPSIFLVPIITFLTPLILFFNKQKKDLIFSIIISVISISLQLYLVRIYGVKISIGFIFLLNLLDMVIKTRILISALKDLK